MVRAFFFSMWAHLQYLKFYLYEIRTLFMGSSRIVERSEFCQ